MISTLDSVYVPHKILFLMVCGYHTSIKDLIESNFPVVPDAEGGVLLVSVLQIQKTSEVLALELISSLRKLTPMPEVHTSHVVFMDHHSLCNIYH